MLQPVWGELRCVVLESPWVQARVQRQHTPLSLLTGYRRCTARRSVSRGSRAPPPAPKQRGIFRNPVAGIPVTLANCLGLALASSENPPTLHER